ncbi:N-acetylmuramoyl-L-alanine amidase [Tateyamaria sp.]|uniref:N-acetylmuramoyl-L-alanine amidase n=1 Tax=Tateyamaria sp. TaxID=1929288 RepID=UPI003B214E7E
MSRRIDEVIIHCSATRRTWYADESLNAQVAEIRRWHVVENKWNDIGYHWIIGRCGKVLAGRAESVVGAHCKGRNARSMGICLIGGHGSSERDAFQDNFTAEQERALVDLIESSRSRHGASIKVRGHNEFANKACPGFNVKRWLNNTPPRTSPLQSKTVRASATQVAAAAGTGATAVAALDGTAQIVALACAAVVALAALWIMRERLRKWAGGDH